MRRTGAVENLTSHYIAAMGAYRFLYMINWGYRYLTEGARACVVWYLLHSCPLHLATITRWLLLHAGQLGCLAVGPRTDGALRRLLLYVMFVAAVPLCARFLLTLRNSRADYYFRSKYYGQKFTLPGATEI